jgi:hypothetical protein
MGATIVAGSEAVVVALSRPPRTSELWAYVDRRGGIVVHRFRRRTVDGALVFRGDGQPYFDVPVPAGHLVGRVVSTRSAAGTVRRFGAAERLRWVARRAVGRGARRVLGRNAGRRRRPS